MSQKSEIIIIGGGVIGTSIAYQLAKRGKKVTLMESHDHASGASGSCDQNIFLQSKNPGIHLELALASAKMFDGLEEELGSPIEYHRRGGMILIESPAEMEIMKSFVARQKQIGLEVDIIGRSEAIKLQPGLAEHIVGSTYSTMDAEVNPIELNIAYARAARKLGVDIKLETAVTDLMISNNRVIGVVTNKGEFQADLVVNATGAWAAQIAAMAGLQVPIKPRRGQIIITEPVPRFIKKGILSAQYIVAKYNPQLLEKSSSLGVKLGVGLSLSQTDKGNILIGATREFVGYDTTNSREGIREILKNATRLIPPLQNVNIIRTMGGIRPYTPDGLPLVGFVKGIDGLFMAAGHEGDGIALAPVTGRIAAELITEGKAFIDVEPLNPNRFN